MAAAVHALSYAMPFLLLSMSAPAIAFIVVTHFVIDRWRLARFIVWAKNGCQGPITATGYSADTQPWMAVWLLIIADNTLHLICNGIALRWLV